MCQHQIAGPTCQRTAATLQQLARYEWGHMASAAAAALAASIETASIWCTILFCGGHTEWHPGEFACWGYLFWCVGKGKSS